MAASFERRIHIPGVSVWIGKYRNLHNLPHWHLEYELIACRDGCAELTLDGVCLSMGPNTAALCPPGSIHHIRADDRANLITAQLSPSLLSFLGRDVCLKKPVFEDRLGIFEALDAVLEELKEQPAFYARRTEAVMVRLCIDLFRQEEWEAVPLSSGTAQAQYRELLSAIDRELEFITFSDAAARMHMSEAYFSRYFRRSAGMTFSEYLNLVKVDRAVGILKQTPEISTSDLALQCGFNTLRSFNRVFRKLTGYSPRQLPRDFSLNIRQYAVGGGSFDPTLSESVPL